MGGLLPLWLLALLVPACTGQVEHLGLLTLGPWVQIQRFIVPKFVARGLNASLECDYVVQQHATLYSLKWYKGSSQFYQYIPSKTLPHAVFSVKGLKKNQVVAGRDERHITLSGVEVGASDVYRCELVAEGPPFHTTQRSANMTVVVLPRGPPVITGSRNYYQHNERVALNCTSPPSRPAVVLSWTVNDQQVSDSHVRTVEKVTNPAGLERVTTRLSLRVTQDHFRGGTMTITCEGRLADLYARTARIRIREPSSRWFTSTNLYHTSASSHLAASWCSVVAALGVISYVLCQSQS
ncbi:uncharacterized protein LOC123518183 [Portunus trituberculatus]|uniref:uncharacterized protein LOC123518183 n=1 Tax=Portunus trituberculatus TaxID=210409 RepID=UPI001E1CB87B|nr:uncharacterized protein LOC123518183 [Portunus trituberculatus]